MGRKSTNKWSRRAQESNLLRSISEIRNLDEEEKKRLDILREMLHNKKIKGDS